MITFCNTVKSSGYAGYVAAIFSKAHNEDGLSLRKAFSATKTGQSYNKGLPPPKWNEEGSTAATARTRDFSFTANIRINRDRTLFRVPENRVTGYLEDIMPCFIKESTSATPERSTQPSRTVEIDPDAQKLSSHKQSMLKRLAATAVSVAEANLHRLESLKIQSQKLERDDFLWCALLTSFATMGTADAYDSFLNNRKSAARVDYFHLASLSPNERHVEITHAVTEGGLRWPSKKAEYILSAFNRIQDMGGPGAAMAQLRSKKTAEEMMRFASEFKGIGDKYARNMFMDIYHPNFRNRIAIDVRIQKISDAHDLTFDSYSEHEAFYLAVAKSAGLTGSELDRLMFHYTEEFLKA